MGRFTPKSRESNRPTPDLLGKGRERNTKKVLFRNLIRDVIVHHEVVHVGASVGAVGLFQKRCTLSEQEINKKSALLFVVVPGIWQENHPSGQHLYISAGLVWAPGTATAVENKVQYFCGSLADVTGEELIIPLDTTLTIGRKEPVFSAFVDQRFLSQVQARIHLTRVEANKYDVTVKDGGEEKPSTNGNTILIPRYQPVSLDQGNLDEPARSGFRKRR